MPEIEKLPKWAQEHIKDLNRQRDVAIRALNEYCDKQTESKFYIDESEFTGESVGPTSKRRYIQTRKIYIEHASVLLTVIIREGEIDIGWSNINHHGDVAFMPSSYMQARLVAKENMR